jgi:osmotically-inducible protein OsmY
VGLDGQFDESGLAKRVAKALDDANISDSVGLWVAQTGSTVVLKYNPDAQGVLEQAKKVAMGVEGATAVNTQPNS